MVRGSVLGLRFDTEESVDLWIVTAPGWFGLDRLEFLVVVCHFVSFVAASLCESTLGRRSADLCSGYTTGYTLAAATCDSLQRSDTNPLLTALFAVTT